MHSKIANSTAAFIVKFSFLDADHICYNLRRFLVKTDPPTALLVKSVNDLG